MRRASQPTGQGKNRQVAGKFRTPIEVPPYGCSLPVNVDERARRSRRRGATRLIGVRSEARYPRWHFWRHPWTRAFWNRAYKENITGLAGMVAYNLMLAVFPFALLVLFIFGQIVNSP